MNTRKTLVMVAFCIAPLTSEAKTGASTNSSTNQKSVSGLPTAQQQIRGSELDVEMTRQARQRLVNDTDLSVAARNVSIVTLNQKMTLQGMVATQAERTRIVELVSSVSPELKIEDQLRVSNSR